MDDIHRVELVCESCRQLTVHELRYADRLPASSRCTACGHRMRHEEQDPRAELRTILRR
ncbi:MAG: hypothetical protein V7637_2233 [Mycobacteriales bacterium]